MACETIFGALFRAKIDLHNFYVMKWKQDVYAGSELIKSDLE